MAAIVPIIMGSRSDLPHGEKVRDALSELGIASEIRVASAHKATKFVLELLAEYEADGREKVYVAIAGRSNALGGVIDANVTAPVISCPPYSDRFGGADVFSSLRMPSGVVPALLLDAQGAALFAAKILAVADPALRDRVHALQRRYTQRLLDDDAQIRGIRH